MFDSDLGERLLINFFELSPRRDDVTKYLAISLLVSRSDSFEVWLSQHPEYSVNSELLGNIFLAADPVDCATILLFAGGFLSRPMFEQLYLRARTTLKSLDGCRDLISAVHLYNIKSKDPIAIERILVCDLLKSRDIEHRITGLKAMQFSEFSVEQRAEQIVGSIRSNDGLERLGGLNRLLELVESCQSAKALMFKLDIQSALALIVQWDTDSTNRDLAQRIGEMIGGAPL